MQIATRSCEVPESVRIRAMERAEKLTRYESRLSGAEIVFETERHLRRVDGVLSVHGSEPIVAHGEGTEFRAALDQMLDRLARMLRRRRSQDRDHQASRITETPVSGE